MRPAQETEYLAAAATLQEALGVPLLAELALPTRSSRRDAGLTGLRPDPRVADRLFHFVQADALTVALVGLGEGGEEWPVAVGLAERAASSGCAPVLLVGTEGGPASPQADAALRPVVSPTQTRVLGEFYPDGCGALPAGIQGVFQARSCSPGESAETPLEPGGIVIALRGADEMARLGPDLVSGVVLVVPYRDVPTQGLTEQVTKISSLGYPVLGAVAVTASAALEGLEPTQWIPPSSSAPIEEPKMPEEEREGGAMDKDVMGDPRPPEAQTEEPANDQRGAPREPEPPAPTTPEEPPEPVTSADPVEPEAPPVEESPAEDESVAPEPSGGGDVADEAMLAAAAGRIPVRRAWTDSYGPGGAKRRGLPWWGYILLVVVLGSAAILVYRTLAPSGTLPSEDQIVAEAEPVETADGQLPEDAQTPVASTEADGPVVEPADHPAEADRGVSIAERQANETPAMTTPARQEAPPPAAKPKETEPEASKPAVRRSETPAPQVPAQTSLLRPPYALLCGSFRSEDLAGAEVQRLSRLGLDTRTQPIEIPEKGIWYRVVAGAFPSRDEAHPQRTLIIEKGWVETVLLVADGGRGPVFVPAD